MQVVVDDLVAHYSLEGKGKLLVLLHGWGDTSRGLEVLSKSLSQSYKVLRIDLPGFGQSQQPPKAWNLDDYALFVQHFLEKLDLTNVYAIFGHSNGGAIAIRGLAQKTLSAQKLVLLASAGVRDNRSPRRVLMISFAKVGKAATLWLPASQRRKLRGQLYQRVGSDLLVVPAMAETFKRVVRQDVQADATQLTIPTLLLNGSADKAVPPTYGRKLAKAIPGARLEILDNAGHFLHQEQPQPVLAFIEEFLR